MCRNIRTLHNFDPPVSSEEIHAAALQYVRKVSGYNKPSRRNEAAFLNAVDEIAAATNRLLASLESHGQPKNREAEAEKARLRGLHRND